MIRAIFFAGILLIILSVVLLVFIDRWQKRSYKAKQREQERRERREEREHEERKALFEDEKL